MSYDKYIIKRRIVKIREQIGELQRKYLDQDIVPSRAIKKFFELKGELKALEDIYNDKYEGV